MSAAYATLLSMVLPKLSLANAGQRAQLAANACYLPSATNGLLEVRLGHAGGAIDLSQSFPKGGGQHVAHWLQEAEPPRSAGVAALFRGWCDPDDSLSRNWFHLGLEFDLAGKLTAAPTPNLFLKPDAAYAQPDRLASESSSLPWLLGQLYPDTAHATHRALAERLHAAPTGSSVSYLGFMLARSPAPLRLNLHGVHYDHLPDYLRSLGCATSLPAVERALELAAAHYADAILCIDPLEPARSKIGLEFFPVSGRSSGAPEGFLEALARAGLCEASLLDPLRAWPGTTFPRELDDDWRKKLGLRTDHGPAFISVRRDLSHIKLDSAVDGTLSAKAYLNFQIMCTELTPIA